MSDFIDFRPIKERVSIEAVLNQYNIVRRLRRVNQHTLRGACPLPTHSSETSKESFSVHTVKNIWSCQSDSCASARDGRKGGNILDFVSVMERCTIREAGVKLYNWFLSSASQSKTPEKVGQGSEATEKRKLVSKREVESDKVLEVESENKPLAFTLKDIDHVHSYLQSRGLTPETAQKFGVGFFPGRGSMSGRIVFEIHNTRGELVAYAGRSIDDSEPKYKFPPGFHKSLELWNLHRLIGGGEKLTTVIVVEGFFDCIAVHKAGYPCVALMGSSLSDEQEKLLCSHFTGAVLLFDGDDAGFAATDDCLLRLGRQMWVKAGIVPQRKQPDQLSADEIKKILSI
jgi:DNA primase